MGMPRTEVETSGVVTDVLRFRGSQDQMGVITLVDADKKKQKVVGVVEGVRVGDSIEVTGYEAEHPHYGPQIRAQHINTILPRHKSALSEWLIRHFGIPWSDARNLVDEWYAEFVMHGQAAHPAPVAFTGAGDFEALRLWNNILVDAPAVRQLFVKHHSTAQYLDVQKYVIRKNVTDTLVRMGLETKEAFALFMLRGAKAAEELKADPYVVYYYLDGTQFSKIDKIYLDQPGNKPNDDRRVRASCLYELRSCTDEGHTAMYYDDFIALIEELHPEFSATRLMSNIQSLMPEFISLYGNPSMIQLSPYARFEAGIAEFVTFGKVHTVPPSMEFNDE